MSDPLKQFIANLRARREALGLTQDDVAWSACMDQSYYSRIERGRVDPSIRTVVKVAAALEIDASELLRGVRGSARALGDGR